MSNLTETKAAISAVKEQGFEAYVALTLSEDLSNTLRSGESLEFVAHELAAEGVAALMINCSSPESIDRAMPVLAKLGIRFGGYANGFTSVQALKLGGTVDSLTARIDLSKEKYLEHVYRWLEEGATIIGGCCEISPSHIAYLREHLMAANYHLSALV